MADQPRFELYAFWRTSATYRVRVALNLKGLAAQERIVNLDAGEQRGEAFLKINPLGAIPALVEPGFPPLTNLRQSSNTSTRSRRTRPCCRATRMGARGSVPLRRCWRPTPTR